MSAKSDRWVVVAEDVSRTYRTGAEEVHALRSLDLRVPEGRMLAVTGRSGSGKTTLLNCLGGLDRPDSGRITVAGQDLTALDEDGLLRMRRETVGFIFQTFALIPILSARENVGLPLRLLGVDAGEREERVATLLGLVDLTEHAEQRPYELSGGQQQRVAIARALVTRPRVLLADEPTGQLDSGTGRAIMQLLRAVVDSLGVTAVVATHDAVIIDTADTVRDLHDGEFGGRHRATGPAA